MKNNIDVNQLADLKASQILALSQNPLIDTVWADWQTERKVQSALDAFHQKGMRHSSLMKTAERCNSANLIHLLRDLGMVQVESSTRKDDPSYFLWEVVVLHPETQAPLLYTHVNLCDALWSAYINHPNFELAEVTS